MSCLIVDEQLDWVIAPFDQHDLVRLARRTVGEGRSNPGTGAGLDPHGEGKRVHLREALGDASVQVVCPLREVELEQLWRLKITTSYKKQQ